MTFDPVAYINEPRWQESRLGLERIRLLLDLLGRPQDSLKFVHVAGTNGKGSTCSYLSSILRCAGYKTGLFTSPFIEAFEERIQINGSNISLEDLTEITLRVRDKAEVLAAQTGDHPTEFELMTAVALEYFAVSQCDIVVLEVGLGGRLDSTNVIDADTSEVAVIASIALDHTGLLGETLAEIACEKAGIIKPGKPVVSWPHNLGALEQVARIAKKCGSELTFLDLGNLEIGSVVSEGGDDCPELVRPFSYKGVSYKTQLLGKYQPRNASLALEVIGVLRQRGWLISEKAASEGIARAQWAGRFEVVPTQQGCPLCLVDGGHNVQGAQALVESLEDVFPDKKIVFVMSVLRDKDYKAMVKVVLPLAEAFITVAPDSGRALGSFDLAQEISELSLGVSPCPVLRITEDFSEALDKAYFFAGSHGVVCVFGSLYSIAAAKRAICSKRP